MFHALCFMNIIILGPQGSGKGTQAELLAQKYDLEHIDIGGTLRQIAKMETPLGKKIYTIQNISKSLVPNEILKKILRLKIASLNREKGVVLDGVPRTLEQARFLEDLLFEFGRIIDRVFLIKVSTAESLNRIAKRWNCRQCKSILIMGKDIENNKDKCPKCGGEIYQREDDTPEGVKKRLEIFEQETMPVAEYFRQKGKLIEVNGEKSVQEVFSEIMKCLE